MDVFRVMSVASIFVTLMHEFEASPCPGWLNKVGGSFNYTCPDGEAITEVRSTYTHHLLHKDRKWSFKCDPTFLLDGEAEYNRETCSSDSKGEFDCKCRKGVLVGVFSKKPGKRYYRTFEFTCLYVRPRNLISCHHVAQIFGVMRIPFKEESSYKSDGPISGIATTRTGSWAIQTNKQKGCICQPGFRGKYCLESCSTIPCSLEETSSIPGEEFDFYCPSNQVVSNINYYVTIEGKTQWNVKCRHSPLLYKNVKCQTVHMRADRTMKCPEGGLIAGIQYKPNQFSINCCSGLPLSAESCSVEKSVKAVPFNPSGGSFSTALTKLNAGMSGLEVTKRNNKDVWTAIYPKLSCKCDSAEEGPNWQFLNHGFSGFVLGGVWDSSNSLWRATLKMKTGNDSQLWIMGYDQKSGYLINKKGLVLDQRADGLLILTKPNATDSQQWRMKNGRILNEKLRLYLSTYGGPWEGMYLSTIKSPTSLDKDWSEQIFEQMYMCRDSCWKEPCKNGGTCITSSVTGYECNCPSGFQGRTCEENVDECVPSLCQNSAQCIDGKNDYQCKCPPDFVGKDCDIPKDRLQTLEDVRCVDLVQSFDNDKIAMKAKVSICHAIQEGINQDLTLNTIFINLIDLGFRIESPLEALKMIAASSKLRDRFENYPLKCIREGSIKSFPELQRLMNQFKIKAIAENVQTIVKTAVQFYQSRIEGKRGIMELIKLQDGKCGEDPCAKEDILSIIAITVLPNAAEYDGYVLDEYRRNQHFC